MSLPSSINQPIVDIIYIHSTQSLHVEVWYLLFKSLTPIMNTSN